MSKARYKAVKLKYKGSPDSYMIYAGFERKAGFTWFAWPILTVDSEEKMNGFCERNEIELSSTESADITHGTYCPNKGHVSEAWPI